MVTGGFNAEESKSYLTKFLNDHSTNNLLSEKPVSKIKILLPLHRVLSKCNDLQGLSIQKCFQKPKPREVICNSYKDFNETKLKK